MNKELKKQIELSIAINQIGFEYFKNCIKNGATPAEAKKEMMTKSAQEISKRIMEVIK